MGLDFRNKKGLVEMANFIDYKLTKQNKKESKKVDGDQSKNI